MASTNFADPRQAQFNTPENQFLLTTANRDGTFSTTDLRVGLPEGYTVKRNFDGNRTTGDLITYTSPSGYAGGSLQTAQYKEWMYGVPTQPKAPAAAASPTPVGPRSFLAKTRGSLSALSTDQALYSSNRKKNPFLIPFTPNADMYGLNVPT